jgi:hypothetical protein
VRKQRSRKPQRTRHRRTILDAIDEIHAIEEVLACLPSIRRLLESGSADAPADAVGVNGALLALVHCHLARIATTLDSLM